MGGGEQQTSSTSGGITRVQPPPWAEPIAALALQEGAKLQYEPYNQFPWTYQDPFNMIDPYSYNMMTGEQIPRGAVMYQPITSSIAPINQQQLTSMGNIQNWANNPSSVLDTASKQLVATMGGGYQAPYSAPVLASATNQNLATMGGNYLTPGSNPYLAQYAQQAMGDVSRNYMNSIVPQLSAAATRAGAFGGSGDTLMQTEAMRNLGDTLSKTATGIYEPAYEAERNRQLQTQLSATNLYQTAYEQERNRQLQAQLYAPSLDTAYLPHFQAGLAAGDIEQQYRQNYLNELVQRWSQANQWPYMATAAAAGMYSPFVAGTGVTSGNQWGSSTTSMSGASPFSQIMGGAISGLGLLGGIFSDIRTKENMKPLEITAKLNPISFDYKPEFGDMGQIGFIADEIEKLAPGMVTTGADGFKRIQVMSLITLLIKAVQDQQKQINALMRK